MLYLLFKFRGVTNDFCYGYIWFPVGNVKIKAQLRRGKQMWKLDRWELREQLHMDETFNLIKLLF